MRLIPIIAAVTIGLFSNGVMAQSKDPGSSPAGVSATGGKPQPVDPAEVKRENAVPGGAPAAAADTEKKMTKKHAKKHAKKHTM